MLQGVWQTPQGVHSLLYYFNKTNPLGGTPNPNDPQYSRWETALQMWLTNNPGALSNIPANIAAVPVSYDTAPTTATSTP